MNMKIPEFIHDFIDGFYEIYYKLPAYVDTGYPSTFLSHQSAAK